MLDVRSLTVRYDRNGVYTDAVNNVSFKIENGSFTGIVGESGSGKSTMITASLGLLPAGTQVGGEIYFDGANILAMPDDELRRLRWRSIALVPQGALNSFTPVITIGRHIAEVLKIHSGLEGAEADKRIISLLDEVGLDARIKDRYPHELSGGQKQRAAIALALACSPSLLLADEPTTALDVITQAGILKLLSRLRREKKLAIVLVTHDLPMAASVCESLLVMKDGYLVERGSPRDIITDPRHEHTKNLVRAML